jgi:hypothetical protein
MFAYQISLNGKIVATAGLQQGVMSAIANWVFIPSDVAKDPLQDWHAGFSLAGLDNLTSEHLKWFRCDLKPGDEVSIKLVQTESVDSPSNRGLLPQKTSREETRVADAAELLRLCDQLRQIEQSANLSPEVQEALKKASLALIHVYDRGARAEIESTFDSLPGPTTQHPSPSDST